MTESLWLDALASYRLARLLTMDDLTKPVRDTVWKWASDREHHRLAEFVTCPHCVGVWVAAGVVLVAPRALPRRGWRALRLFLAVAGAESLMASAAGALDR
jgi:hypothetical protein